MFKYTTHLFLGLQRRSHSAFKHCFIDILDTGTVSSCGVFTKKRIAINPVTDRVFNVELPHTRVGLEVRTHLFDHPRNSEYMHTEGQAELINRQFQFASIRKIAEQIHILAVENRKELAYARQSVLVTHRRV